MMRRVATKGGKLRDNILCYPETYLKPRKTQLGIGPLVALHATARLHGALYCRHYWFLKSNPVGTKPGMVHDHVGFHTCHGHCRTYQPLATV